MMEKKNFNDEHPELKPDERFVANIWPEKRIPQTIPPSPEKTGMEWFKSLELPGKRLGGAAYDIEGNPLQRARPIFAKKETAQSDPADPAEKETP